MVFSHAISMVRPHEALGLRQPLGRRLLQGTQAWNFALSLVVVFLIGVYVVEVNGAATKSYRLRDIERRVETLNAETLMLQNRYIAQTSLKAISDKASVYGLVPIDTIQYIQPNPSGYAMAKN
jgi:hypothetical protein